MWQWYQIFKKTGTVTPFGSGHDARTIAVAWMREEAPCNHMEFAYFLAEPVLRTRVVVDWGDDPQPIQVKPISEADALKIVDAVKSAPRSPKMSDQTAALYAKLVNVYPRSLGSADVSALCGDTMTGANDRIKGASKDGWAERTGRGMYRASAKLLKRYGREPETEEERSKRDRNSADNATAALHH